MKYTIYKTTNMINDKIYIGMHKCNCKECSYMGSGSIITKAIKKYGRENFKKEIIFEFNTFEEMIEKEKEILSQEFLERADVYNLNKGGKGNWHCANEMYRKNPDIKRKSSSKGGKIGGKLTGELNGQKSIEKMQKIVRDRLNAGFDIAGKIPGSTWLGRKHRDDAKEKMSKNQRGSKNSQYGKFWINDGFNSIKCDGEIPEGWQKGRIVNSLKGSFWINNGIEEKMTKGEILEGWQKGRIKEKK